MADAIFQMYILCQFVTHAHLPLLPHDAVHYDVNDDADHNERTNGKNDPELRISGASFGKLTFLCISILEVLYMLMFCRTSHNFNF